MKAFILKVLKILTVHLGDASLVDTQQTKLPRGNEAGSSFQGIRRPRKASRREQSGVACLEAHPRCRVQNEPQQPFPRQFTRDSSHAQMSQGPWPSCMLSQDTATYLSLVHITLGFLTECDVIFHPSFPPQKTVLRGPY